MAEESNPNFWIKPPPWNAKTGAKKNASYAGSISGLSFIYCYSSWFSLDICKNRQPPSLSQLESSMKSSFSSRRNFSWFTITFLSTCLNRASAFTIPKTLER